MSSEAIFYYRLPRDVFCNDFQHIHLCFVEAGRQQPPDHADLAYTVLHKIIHCIFFFTGGGRSTKILCRPNGYSLFSVLQKSSS